jgi:hypothetical protein
MDSLVPEYNNKEVVVVILGREGKVLLLLVDRNRKMQLWQHGCRNPSFKLAS